MTLATTTGTVAAAVLHARVVSSAPCAALARFLVRGQSTRCRCAARPGDHEAATRGIADVEVAALVR